MTQKHRNLSIRNIDTTIHIILGSVDSVNTVRIPADWMTAWINGLVRP